MNFFDHKDLGNHLLQLCPKVVKHPVYPKNMACFKCAPVNTLHKGDRKYSNRTTYIDSTGTYTNNKQQRKTQTRGNK